MIVLMINCRIFTALNGLSEFAPLETKYGDTVKKYARPIGRLHESHYKSCVLFASNNRLLSFRLTYKSHASTCRLSVCICKSVAAYPSKLIRPTSTGISSDLPSVLLYCNCTVMVIVHLLVT